MFILPNQIPSLQNPEKKTKKSGVLRSSINVMNVLFGREYKSST